MTCLGMMTHSITIFLLSVNPPVVVANVSHSSVFGSGVLGARLLVIKAESEILCIAELH